MSQEPAHGEGAMGRTWVQGISPQQPGAVLEPVPSKTICLPFLGDRRSGTPGTGAFQAGPGSPQRSGRGRCQALSAPPGHQPPSLHPLLRLKGGSGTASSHTGLGSRRGSPGAGDTCGIGPGSSARRKSLIPRHSARLHSDEGPLVQGARVGALGNPSWTGIESSRTGSKGSSSKGRAAGQE